MYDPLLGRWHVIDNKAEKAFSWTPYAYVENNPLIHIDPNGEFKWKLWAKDYRRYAIQRWGKERVSDLYFNEKSGEWAFMVYSEGRNNSTWVGGNDGSATINAYKGTGIYKGKSYRKMKKEMKRTTKYHRAGNPPSVNITNDNLGIKMIEYVAKSCEDPFSVPFTPEGCDWGLLYWLNNEVNSNDDEEDTEESNDSEENQEEESEESDETTQNNNSDTYLYPMYDPSMSPSERDYQQMWQDLKDW